MASRLILLRGQLESWSVFSNYASFFNVRDLFSEPLLETIVAGAQLANTGGGIFIAVVTGIEDAKRLVNRYYYAAPENSPYNLEVYPVRWGNDSMILDLIEYVQKEQWPVIVNLEYARLTHPCTDGCHGSSPSGAN
ncbi:hypothetical protein LU11_gp090 [Pseudomonas phage Lu11]|uniref:hypothetical protein n=1 Tax=Pseudomonas phage Lu11 TaxID=1161927 RepID=UPI00025F1534|nr:hypothetical protein LU11_gp090 [Pseudomonas phage Lu11]AFH14621.1 hypothetical protein Lu11_0089 [Pseudomonas phage Lu11]